MAVGFDLDCLAMPSLSTEYSVGVKTSVLSFHSAREREREREREKGGGGLEGICCPIYVLASVICLKIWQDTSLHMCCFCAIKSLPRPSI